MSVENKATFKENLIQFFKLMREYAGDYFSGQKWKQHIRQQKTR